MTRPDLTVAELLAYLDGLLSLLATDDAAWRQGYRIGYLTGVETAWMAGLTAGMDHADRLWSAAIAGAKRTAERPTHTELARRRAELPERGCPRRCGRCSVCIGAAWRHRHPNYLGGPVPWNPNTQDDAREAVA